ncbi:MAG: hypothetical protein SFY68_02015 [Candidatus Sumerlaeia bacterium]|nr:hypothetical protein [Candidatus Sumerlaeia bacterium]
MAIWQTQEQFPSETSRTREAVSYLNREIGRESLYQLFDEYFSENPQGEQVTLAVLRWIGRKRMEDMAKAKATAKGKNFDAMRNLVKQHIGLWVAIGLANHYGSQNVETYRQYENGPSSTRKASDSWKPELDWVNSYTPHRLVNQGKI